MKNCLSRFFPIYTYIFQEISIIRFWIQLSKYHKLEKNLLLNCNWTKKKFCFVFDTPHQKNILISISRMGLYKYHSQIRNKNLIIKKMNKYFLFHFFILRNHFKSLDSFINFIHWNNSVYIYIYYFLLWN